ncbi:MAG: hypothetical protein ACRDP4_06955 [Nocardioidaceae bacterium]
MTSKEQLLQLVEGLPGEQAEEVLRLAREILDQPGESRSRPAWFGAVRLDPRLSERHEEVLREKWGHDRRYGRSA